MGSGSSVECKECGIQSEKTEWACDFWREEAQHL